MKQQVGKIWRVLLILLCISVFGILGGQSIYAVSEVTDPTVGETETTIPQDAASGQYKIWFVTGDAEFVDEDGLSVLQWNMKSPGYNGFGLPNTGIIRAFVSADGNTPADLTGIVDQIKWEYTIAGLGEEATDEDYAKIIQIMPKDIMDNFEGGPEKNQVELMINPRTAGLVKICFTITGTRNDGTTPIKISRSIVIGSPLQIYSYPQSIGRDYTDFYGTNKDEITIFANNSQNEAGQIYWFYLDAEGNYHSENPAWIGLEEPIYRDGESLPSASDIVEVTIPSEQNPVIKNGVSVLPYTLKLKDPDKAGGFTRIVGRIYLGGDSRTEQYIECTYDVIAGAQFKNSDILEMTYGQSVYFNTLANDKNNHLGWISYRERNENQFLTGAEENGAQYRDGEVLLIDSNGITAQNFGEVTLEATSLFRGWEDFDNIVKNVTDLKTVRVRPSVLKGKIQKTVIDNVEVIPVGGTISLSTNVVSSSNEYEYRWEYLPESAVPGSALQSWRALGSAVVDARFSINEVVTGNEGITALSMNGKTSGSIQMKCTVRRRGSMETVLEEIFTVKIVDTMTLSETSKTIAVGGQFDIEAFVSGLTTGSEVEWSVVNSEDEDYISFTKVGTTIATVTALAPTNGRIECKATAEINGTTTSATFYVMVVSGIDEIYIQPDPSAVIAVGGSTKLNLILRPDGMNYTKDQIKWVLKEVHGQPTADTIIKKEESASNFLQVTITGLLPGEAYVAVVTNDSVQTEIAVITIKVVSEVESLTLSAHDVIGYLPGSYILTATPEPKGFVDRNDLAVKWEASNNIVTITPDPEDALKAMITYNEVGTVRVTAFVSGLPAKADSCIFTIENAATGLSLDPKECNMRVGETRPVTATIDPEEVTNPTLTWRSENENIATVSKDGVITAISPGTTFITCITSNGISNQVMVTVLNSVEMVELNHTDLTVKKGTHFFLSANVHPDSAADRSVVWSSSDESICFVDTFGNVTANAAGTCMIKAACNEDSSIYAECFVTVTESVNDIVLNYQEKTIKPEEVFILKAMVLPSGVSDKGVTFSSSNSDIVTVTEEGLVTGIASGTAMIVVRSNESGFIATCIVTVQQDMTDTTFLSLSEVRKKIEVGGSFEIEAYSLSVGVDTKVEWSVIDKEYQSNIMIESTGYHTARIIGLDSTKGNYVTCRATAEVNGRMISGTFYVEVLPAIKGAKIKASPSSVISIGETVQLDLLLDTIETSFTKDQISWVVKRVEGQEDPKTIIEKKDNDSNILKTTITGLSSGEAYVAAILNDSVQTEIAIITIKVVPNIKAIELNTHEAKGNVSDNIVLTAMPYPAEYADTENLKLEWSCYPDNGMVTIVPDSNNPLNAVVTFHRAGIACIRIQVSDMPRVEDFCMLEIKQRSVTTRPSDNDKDDDDDDDNSNINNNPASGSGLTSNEQNQIEAVLGSNITIQVVIGNHVGKLIVTMGREVVFCEKEGILSKDKWQKVDGLWYYFGSNSKAVDGWLKTGDKWYYMNKDNKQMETGWIQTADGKWYLLDENNGDMKTGWQQRNGIWYLLDKINGDMKIGWQMVDGKWYYLTESGAMAVNTRTPDGYQVDNLGVWIP